MQRKEQHFWLVPIRELRDELKRRDADGQRALHLFNAGDRHLKSCQSLGLDRLARIDLMQPDDPAFLPPLDSEFCQLPDTDLTALKKPADSLGAAQVMLEAHEDLCATDERNEPKFKDVKQFLREEIGRKMIDIARRKHGGNAKLRFRVGIGMQTIAVS
jgi:hypothetical protein